MRNTIAFLRPFLLLSLTTSLGCPDDGPSGDGGSSGTDDSSGGPTTQAPTSGPTTAEDGTGTTGSTDDDGSSGTTGEPPVEATIPELVKELVQMENDGVDVPGFPLEYIPASGELSTIPQLEWKLVAAFLDSLTDAAPPMGPVWGANNDYIAYLGDGWQDEGTPYFAGSGEAGWMWTNFEYISNDRASEGAAPTGIGLQMVTWLADNGVPEFQFDVSDDAEWTPERVDAYILWHKRMLGGALFRVSRGDEGWSIDTSADNLRFDATSDTLFRITGPIDIGVAQDDAGADLPANVVPGTSSNCSGGISPWGTIFSAEENTQFAYGDLEACWSSSNVFIPGGPCDPGSDIVWDTTPNPDSDFTRGTATNTRPDYYSYLVEIDPESPPDLAYDPSSGNGHQKLGAIGRANWENATFHVGADRRLVPDVSAVSDPFTGVQIVFNRQIAVGGGTSQAAPIWAGLTALMNQRLRDRGAAPLGELNPMLYRIAKSPQTSAGLRDINLGGNAISISGTVGYDMVTGLGTPNVANLIKSILLERANA